MPELPAVEYSRRLLEENVLNHRITKVIATEDSIIFEESQDEIERKLTGLKIIDTKRYGKFLWIVFEKDAYLLMHLGMTGYIQVQGTDRLYYKSAPEKETTYEATVSCEWPPRFWKLQLETDGGCKVVFGDSRRLGRVKILYKDPMTVPPVSKLGFDPILSMPKFSQDLFKEISKRSVPLKSYLLDQSFAAGVGNWMADDILLHAQLHPETRASDLDEEEVKRLLDAIQFISVTAVNVNSDGSKFPKTWIFHYRWPTDRKKEAFPTIQNHKISFITVGGRTTAYVPDLQKKKPSKAPSTQGSKKRQKIKK